MQYEMLNTDFKLSLVQGLMAIGQFDIALARIDETISLVEENGDLLHMPEALRVREMLFFLYPSAEPMMRKCVSPSR